MISVVLVVGFAASHDKFHGRSRESRVNVDVPLRRGDRRDRRSI